MANLLTGDDKFRDLTYDDGHRADPVTRTNSYSDYRFARAHGRRPRARAALRRVSFYLKNTIAAIVDVKLRRIERESEINGIGYDRRGDCQVAGNPGRTDVGED
jgi:hypothetical protein